MYRVRLPSGDEKTYRSIEEMVWDVELGVITRDAQMFHAASKSWVTVSRHPQLGSRFPDSAGQEEVGLEFDLLSDDEMQALAPRHTPQPQPGIDIIADLALEAASQAPLANPAPPAEVVTPTEPVMDPPVASAEPPAPEPPLVQEPERPFIEPPPEPAIGLATAGDMLLEPPPPRPADLRPLSEVEVHTEPPSPPPPAEPAPPQRARRMAPRETTPVPSSYLPEPSLDGDLAPLPDEPVEYKPLEWKPEPRFRGLALIGGAVAAVAVLGTGLWYGIQGWGEREAEKHQGAEIVIVDDTVAARQAVDSVSDSALAMALRTLAIAETVGTGERPLPVRPGRVISSRPVEGLRPMTPSELRRSYAEAYANARTAMDSDLALAGVGRLLSNARLSSRDSLRSGRRLITSARNIIRVFHGDEVQIERAYRDTVAFQTAKMGWTRNQQADWKSRATLKESYEGSQLSDSLLNHIDALYTLLLGRWSEYELRGGVIVFDDPTAANEYDRIAKWLNRTIARLDTGSENTTAPTARRLVRGLGGTRPPTLQRSRIPD